jgi:hypothetical protein
MLLAPSPLECFICLYIGTSQRSRTVLFFWLCVVISVVPQIALSAALRLATRSSRRSTLEHYLGYAMWRLVGKD